MGFIILGIIIDCGGTGPQGYIGGKYWSDPGAFANGFPGFCSVFVVAAFAFGGTELVGLAAAESREPHKSIPSATRQVFWRIAIFYVLNLLMVGLLVPYTDSRLLSASTSNTKDSPFVIAILDAGIPALPSIFNVVITLSVISVANSCAFGSTRTMQALAERGMAPRFLGHVDKKGRPLYATIIQLLFGLLAFIGESAQEGTVFTWLLSLSGLSYFFVWGTICLAHIRFRRAWVAQGRSVKEMPYRTPLGVIGSYIGLGLNILCLIATFYVSVWVCFSPLSFFSVSPKLTIPSPPAPPPTPRTFSSNISPRRSYSPCILAGNCTAGNGACGCLRLRWILHLGCARIC